MKERIACEELIKFYKIELTFLESLEESGLVHPEVENNVKYILYEELPQVEQYANWHYDLEVNLPGIEVIHHLLETIKELKEERRKLQRRLQFHKTPWEDDL